MHPLEMLLFIVLGCGTPPPPSPAQPFPPGIAAKCEQLKQKESARQRKQGIVANASLKSPPGSGLFYAPFPDDLENCRISTT